MAHTDFGATSLYYTFTSYKQFKSASITGRRCIPVVIQTVITVVHCTRSVIKGRF